MLAGAVLAALLVLALHFMIPVAHGRPNEAWRVLKAEAESQGDIETLRRLKYVGSAGTLRWPNGQTYKASCCGEADAYEADDFDTDADGNLYAVLTCNDPRDCEEVKGKLARPPGARFKIPAEKVLVNRNPVNDTGHGWVWISATSTDGDGDPAIYCYAPPAGG
jgi:hypothetical protein